jgi:tetratricopeptide (TPR) repeat protein
MAESHRRQLNVKLAILLPAILAVCVGAVYGLHEWQVRETAQKMKARAEAAYDRGDLNEAIRSYQYYLRYERDDDEALVRYALLSAERARKRGGQAMVEVYRLLERASVAQPDNADLIRQMAEIGERIGRGQAAAEHYKRLIQLSPDRSDLHVALGRCLIRTEHYRDAIKAFQDAIAIDPKNLDAYSELADLARQPQLDDLDYAEDVMNQMVSTNPKAAGAYVKRGLFWKALGDDERAHADIDKARRWPSPRRTWPRPSACSSGPRSSIRATTASSWPWPTSRCSRTTPRRFPAFWIPGPGRVRRTTWAPCSKS